MSIRPLTTEPIQNLLQPSAFKPEKYQMFPWSQKRQRSSTFAQQASTWGKLPQAGTGSTLGKRLRSCPHKTMTTNLARRKENNNQSVNKKKKHLSTNLPDLMLNVLCPLQSKYTPQKAFSMVQSIHNCNSAVSFNTAQSCSQNVFYIQNTGQNDSRKTRRIIMFIFLFRDSISLCSPQLTSLLS